VLFIKELQGWTLDETIGKLHRLWWWCLDYALDGNLAKHPFGVIAGSIDVPPDQASTFVMNMVKARLFDAEPYLRVHDWWEYAGRYLKLKYKEKPEKWQEIKALYENPQATIRVEPPVLTPEAPPIVQAVVPKPAPVPPAEPKAKKGVSLEAEARFEEFWKFAPDRGGKKVGKAKARELFLALKDEEQVQCIQAVKAYARYCREQDRTPKDPFRFIKGQDGELWRDFIPPPPTIRPVPKPSQRPTMGEPPPKEAAEILDRLRVGIGKSFPGRA
jgi:hypothetical protein